MKRILYLLGFCIVLIACGVAPNEESASLPNTPGTRTPSMAPSPTGTPPVATHEPTAIPSATITPVPTETPTATISPTATRTLAPSATPTATVTPELVALPGEAWNMELVGHHALDSLGWWASMGLGDSCVYVGSYTQARVPIVDVADPQNPRLIGSIPLPEGSQPVEVRALPERNLLVVADEQYARLYTYDISDCAHPELQGTFQLPGSPHEFFLWYDDTRVLAYAALFDEAPPDLVVVDLTDPAAPYEAGRWTGRAEGAEGLLHSVSVSPEGDRVYLALWDGGLLVAQVDLPDITLYRDEQGTFSPALMPNTHSAVALGDPRYIVMAAEVFQCPFEGLALADIADPAHPHIVSHFLLPENTCEGLPDGGPTFTPHNPTIVGDWVVTSWYAAGIQVIDWRDRLNPVRVGQFVPSTEGAAPRSLLGTYPVQTFSYPILKDGLIYFVDSSSGLYIVRYTGPGAEEINNLERAEGNLTIRP